MKLNTFLIVLSVSLLTVHKMSFAQITFDSNPVANNSAGTGNTVDVTVPMGNSRLLVAMIGTNDLTNSPTVTFNGMSMSKAAEDDDNFNTTYDARILVYYLALGDGNAISNTISVSGLTANTYYTVSGLSFQGIDQISPVKQSAKAGTPTGNASTSQVAASITGVTAGNLLFSFFGEDNVKQFDWGGTYIASGSQTNAGVNAAGYYYATYNTAATVGDHTFTFDINNGYQSCAGVLIEFAKKSTVILPSVSVALSPTSALENSSTPLDYTFTVNPAPASDLTVNFTISGTAEDDDDFAVGTPGTNNETVNYTNTIGAGNSAGTIIIKAGETTGLLRITQSDDAAVEANETVIITINN